MKRVVVIVIAGSLMLASTSAVAQVPRVLGYHGMLTDTNGKPIPSTASQNVTFSIYKSATATGKAPWYETQAVKPDSDGYFSVVLGSKTPIPDGLFGTSELYLELRVGTQTLSPRQRIVSTPYTLLASAGGTLEIRGSVDMSNTGSSSYQYTKKVKVRLKSRARSFKLRLVGEEFTRYHYTELPKHSHPLTGAITSEAASCTKASSHSHTLSATTGPTKAACVAAGAHTHKATGSIGSTTVAVNSVGHHSHSLSGTANNNNVSCGGGDHYHYVSGYTGYQQLTHQHLLRTYNGGNVGCPGWASPCPTTGFFESGNALGLIFHDKNCTALSPSCTYGIHSTSKKPGGQLDYYVSNPRVGTTASTLNHRHSIGFNSQSKGHSHNCGYHKHTLTGSALSGGSHGHTTKAHGHTLSLTVPSVASHSHTCTGHTHGVTGSTTATGGHGHTCTHSHKNTLAAGSTGIPGYTLATTAKQYPNDLTITVDNKDCTSEILLLANKNWGGTSYMTLGNGTATHPLVAGYKSIEGTGEIDLLKLNYCINGKVALAATGEHEIKITHKGKGGGKVRYEIVVER